MKSGQVTIKDIARQLSISPSTVSRALKDHPDISPDTKKAVKELAEKLDYQPNSIALSLRKSRTNTIGIIMPQLVHHFFSTVISGIEDVAHGAGYNVIIAQSNENYDREVSNTQALLASRVDGLLVSISRETTNDAHFRNVQRRGVPLIFWDRVAPELEATKIVVDDHDGTFQATEHLIGQGCKRIAYLAGPEHMAISQARKQGYLDAMKKAGIAVDDSLVAVGGLTKETGADGAKALLDAGASFDGLVTFSDPVAIGAMMALKKAGKQVPGDVAIVGFSDEPLTELVEPPLSSVAQPGYEMGQLAAELLLAKIEEMEKKNDSDEEEEETHPLPLKPIP